MLSKTKNLPEKLSWVKTSDLLRRFFLLIMMLRFYFLYSNLIIAVSFFFFKRWHAWRSSGFTSWPVRDNALQMLLSRTSSSVVAGTTGFISSDSRRWYWALLTAFLSNWTILSLNNRLQFLLTVNSEERISYRLRKSSKQLVRSDSFKICLQHY